MKRVVLLVAAAAGAVAVQQRLKAQQAEQALWADITDVPQPSARS